MFETKFFKFEFIQRNIRYEVSFSANVDKFTAEELYTNLLSDLSKSKFEPEAYLMVFDWFVYKNRKVYQIGNFETNASIVFMPNTKIDWNKTTYTLHKISERPNFFDLNKINEEIGNVDYFFSIKSIGCWYNLFEDNTREAYLVITKRVKTEDGYRFSVMTQFAELDFEERTFYSRFSFVCFSFWNMQENFDVSLSIKKDFLQEDLEEDTEFGEVVIPVEFPRIHEIPVFTDYLEILKNIDNIDSIEKIKSFLTTDKQKILYPKEMLSQE